mmetsp:Transcript_21147/g.48865  ORF Transcript_21147/g.48865 Transcript_21147/m.48865 type:complete len:286 (+) Transcript_21147:1089-1946(+)
MSSSASPTRCFTRGGSVNRLRSCASELPTGERARKVGCVPSVRVCWDAGCRSTKLHVSRPANEREPERRPPRTVFVHNLRATHDRWRAAREAGGEARREQRLATARRAIQEQTLHALSTQLLQQRWRRAHRHVDSPTNLLEWLIEAANALDNRRPRLRIERTVRCVSLHGNTLCFELGLALLLLRRVSKEIHSRFLLLLRFFLILLLELLLEIVELLLVLFLKLLLLVGPQLLFLLKCSRDFLPLHHAFEVRHCRCEEAARGYSRCEPPIVEARPVGHGHILIVR